MTRRAYIIGAGIGSLAVAVYLVRDGGQRSDQITILGLEAHGANDGAAVKEFEGEYKYHSLGNSKGFLNRGGRMLDEETYENFWDVIDSVPPLDRPGRSVTQEILGLDHVHPIKDTGRLIDSEGLRVSGPKSYRRVQFISKQHLLLTRLMMLPESRKGELDDVSIRDWFAETPNSFETDFQWTWQTTFAFKDVPSATELRRYMNRMILESPHINTLEGVTRTPYSQYESVILPLRIHLQGQDVTFATNRRVAEFVFTDIPLHDEIIVTDLRHEEIDNDDAEGLIKVRPEDLVFDANGSVTDSTSIGDLGTAIAEDHRRSLSALLWKQATERFYNLGHPDKFLNDRSQSEWTSFIITTSDHSLIGEISRLTRRLPGNALDTFVDSTPLVSLVVHHQPHYHAQTPEQGVSWGYVLHPCRPGGFIGRPLIETTGWGILLGVIGYLDRIDTTTYPTTDRVSELMATVINVVPTHMPYASALFNRRITLDHPKVVPDGSKNLVFVSQFAGMSFDTVFTEQYSVRCAQVTVYTPLGLDKPSTVLHHYERDPCVLTKAIRVMFRQTRTLVWSDSSHQPLSPNADSPTLRSTAYAMALAFADMVDIRP